MNPESDILVVGSGASAVHAAYPLVMAGHQVTMLDVGYEETGYESLIPPATFAEVRRTDRQQHRYLLGDRFEGIPLGAIGAGPQVTPPRQYVLRNVEKWLPSQSPDFAAMMSLALGGLGGIWGAVSFPFLDQELTKCGLPPAEMQEHYETVAQRIGISGCANDDLRPLRGPLQALQPALELDGNAALIMARYRQRRVALNAQGVYVGWPVMAVLTQPVGERSPNPYRDMDFWSNQGGSVYRPATTVRELARCENFVYRRSFFVERFAEERSGHVQVTARSVASGQTEVFHARRLILAAGAMGTAWIVLRSLEQYDVRVPLTCNATTYIPCLHLPHLGTAPNDRCHSLAQFTMIYDPAGDREHLVQAQVYSYRSMLLFRLMREVPLPYREALRILRALAPSFMVTVLQHEDHPCAEQYCVLRRGAAEGRDALEIVFRPSEKTIRRQHQHERFMMRALRKLGCWPLKTVSPGHGTSAHYASQFPFCPENQPLTTEVSGRLRGTENIYIADGAALAYLPAKGLTFTLMANANRIGTVVLKGLAL